MKATFKFIGNQLEEYLKSAERSILIAIAWFTNEDLFETLLQLIRNGIIVELIVNNDHINNRKDGLNFDEFIQVGGKFYFADSSRLMHHKFIIIDEKITVTGSYNWTYNAEFRNNENIILTDDLNVVKQFLYEFEFIKASAELQPDKIILKPSDSFELQEKTYLLEDFFYKSFAEEKKGNMEKSLDAIQNAQRLENSNIEINKREKEVIKKIENPEYHYHVEDGQFSFDFYENRLIGKEGEIVRHFTDRIDDLDEIYILYVDGFYVECIGNIERSFPENKQEHDKIKKWMIEHEF
ncbi:phospholipase D-like domain-containing protein [Gaoshiqia sp. Z1-71]|uniref:phospholipase D-like domain-containing protein n=1 Tax=Gaoshiqia hydrogeniformans TaxID=3290090 RepID=UPI003BF8B1E6